MQSIYPCLWFNDNAEEAVDFYLSLFPDSEIQVRRYYTEVGQETHGHEAGELLTIDFTLMGNQFTALNGGSYFQFSGAISLQVFCDSQEQLDTFWDVLSAVPEAEACGWLQDKFGVIWQIVPKGLDELLFSGSKKQCDATMASMLTMKKLDLNELQRVFDAAA